MFKGVKEYYLFFKMGKLEYLPNDIIFIIKRYI
jgi:hypothetical protein